MCKYCAIDYICTKTDAMSKKVDDYKISIWHDVRFKKASGMFPVKLRVYGKQTKKVKTYSLDIDLSKKQFLDIWINPENKDLRGINKDIRLKLQNFETRANDEAKGMTVFDFDKFETRMFRKSSDQNNVKYHFNVAIEKCINNDKIGTAESFRCTLNSFAKFSKSKKCEIDKLTFDIITVDWLKAYQKFMLLDGKSITTIGIYTRTLRVIFNNAIRANDLSVDIYPFGIGKYKIPKTKKVKKALSANQLTTLFAAVAENENEQRAKDFWFFSYACNGMNLKDIALLKYSDFKEDSFSYYRAKTFDKSDTKTEIIIYLTDFTNGIISKYGNKNKHGFVFQILDEDDSSVIQYRKIKNFTRLINDHIKRLATRSDLPIDISTYWARHSFATNSIRKGATMEFVSASLNHSDLSVTKNYFAGFEDQAIKEFAQNLMDF